MSSINIHIEWDLDNENFVFGVYFELWNERNAKPNTFWVKFQVYKTITAMDRRIKKKIDLWSQKKPKKSTSLGDDNKVHLVLIYLSSVRFICAYAQMFCLPWRPYARRRRRRWWDRIL